MKIPKSALIMYSPNSVVCPLLFEFFSRNYLFQFTHRLMRHHRYWKTYRDTQYVQLIIVPSLFYTIFLVFLFLPSIMIFLPVPRACTFFYSGDKKACAMYTILRNTFLFSARVTNFKHQSFSNRRSVCLTPLRTDPNNPKPPLGASCSPSATAAACCRILFNSSRSFIFCAINSFWSTPASKKGGLLNFWRGSYDFLLIVPSGFKIW